MRVIHSASGVILGFAERIASKEPLQGSAAEMIKIAIIYIYNKFFKRGLQSRMTMQVHDELVFEVYKPETAVVKQILGDLLRTALPLDARIAVETKTGDNWLAAHQEYTKKQETEKSNSCFHLVFCLFISFQILPAY